MRDDQTKAPTRTPPSPRRRQAGRWIGLQDKLLVSMTLLVCGTLLAGGAAFAWYGGRQVRQIKRQEGGHVAAAAAVAAAHAMTLGEPDELPRRLGDLARQLLRAPGITAVTFYDEHGRPLVAWRNADDGSAAPFVADPLPSTAVTMDRDLRVGEARSPDVLLPIIPRLGDAGELAPSGFVGLRVTDAPAMAYVRRTAQIVAGGGLAVLAAVLPVVFLLVHRAFGPIRRLGVAAGRVAEGRFETVDIDRGDALGVLADAFNHMVVRLAEQRGRVDEAQARLLEANLNLERKVEKRTGEIESASRRLASEIAEKEDFLRAVSHDLNAPLRNIDGMVTMLLRKHENDLPEEVLRRLDRIKKNVQHETDLINELLDLSRIKTRREEPEPTNLEELIWDLRGLFESDLRERQIDLVIESKLPVLVAEKARVRQVFQNLIDNAIKYMGDGPTRQIAVGARVGPAETELWVRDTGRGIPAGDVEKIFFVFRRGSNPGDAPGKGVGLASVKSIVENYHGKIWVESREGSGSTFRFTINGRFVKPEAPLFADNRGRAETAGTAPRGVLAA